MFNLNFCDKQTVHHVCALLLIAGQAAVLDFYLVSFNLRKFGHGYQWLAWVAVDAVGLIIYVLLFIRGRRYVDRHMQAVKEEDPDNPKGLLHFLGILPYAWVCWLFYSVVLVGKIIAIFKTFGTDLLETDHLGINTMEFTFGASAAVFMLFVGGLEHLATSAQKHYIRWMQHFVLLEIVDCVEFLTSLFVAAELEVAKGHEKPRLPHHLENAILAFACINLIAPAHALYRLSSYHNRHPETRNRFFLTQTLVGTVFGNIPYFVVRCYLWDQHSYITGLFAMKNLIGIFTDGQELIEFWGEMRRGRDESDSGSEEEEESGPARKYSVAKKSENVEAVPMTVQNGGGKAQQHTEALTG
ncbi:uncharacterized protein LOC129582665 [Paramacrobiotus metropolitanus]|uniref:uncharacterized protein LOC129582665 n=1 Tax=Paramacrobiotus metropolitanus TaxID=2943436 RepID=UPI0024459EFC|nr:uncharacterized protein LOC129582665 [Paramacrobiotus metropolitanus]